MQTSSVCILYLHVLYHSYIGYLNIICEYMNMKHPPFYKKFNEKNLLIAHLYIYKVLYEHIMGIAIGCIVCDGK